MDFKTLSIITHPPEVVWKIMKDQFQNITDRIEEVDSISLLSRKHIPSGKLEITYIWKVNPKLSDMITRFIKPEMLILVEKAVWDEQNMVCNWTIESPYFKEKMDCRGFTKFNPAFDEYSCQLVYQGSILWENEVPNTFGIMDGMVSQALESIICKLVPNNFRNLILATKEFLELEPV